MIRLTEDAIVSSKLPARHKYAPRQGKTRQVSGVQQVNDQQTRRTCAPLTPARGEPGSKRRLDIMITPR